jgi:hypothetical protein
MSIDPSLAEKKPEVVKPDATGFYGCYTDVFTCDAWGEYGLENGWWNNWNCYKANWTPCGTNIALVYQY